MRNLFCVIAIGLSCFLADGAQPQQQTTVGHPTWAFPVADKEQPSAEDENAPKHVPGSDKTYTQVQIDDLFNPPDWFPDERSPLPAVVARGSGKDVPACGSCHLMSGNGHPESANLAGLSAAYIVATMADFKSGARKDPARMTAIGKAVSEDDVKQSAEWFASLKPVVWTKVVEADTVPKTYVNKARQRLPLPGGGTEPIANRIIEVPQDAARVIARDPHSGFIAYVPVGSLAKGAPLVTTGGSGKTIPCAICHGDGLKGLGQVPRIAGLSPVYIARQLYNFQNGQSAGPMSGLMKKVVENLTDDDILTISAYAASAMQLPAGTDSIVAVSPYFDTHAHFDARILPDPNGEVDAALREMGRENAAKLIFLPGPSLPDDPNRFDHDAFMAALKKHRDRLAFQGGGGSLNPMIQESVRSGDAGPEIQRKFKERAEQIIRDGAVGFGELSSEHLSFLPGQAYETAPPDHPLFLLLADIAAEHGIPIDLHLDAVPQTMLLPSDLKSPPNPAKIQENLSAFERLLSHNPRAKIVWAHAGSDNVGNRTPDLCRRLLQAHPNLYMEIKIDPLDLGKNPPIANGEIKPEWLRLFQDFPDRFVIGTDQHYNSGQPMTGPQRWKMAVVLLNQLPGDLRRKIGAENAQRIFPIPKNP